MTIAWNEIRRRAVAFSKEWETEGSERAEAKSFWDEFFQVFGVRRRKVATFEKPVHIGDGKDGYIDLLWKGTILVEHKSRGKNLDHAFKQAKDYFPGLSDADQPRYVLVSDFANFRLYDLEEGRVDDFLLTEFPNKVRLFGFITGYQKQLYPSQDPVNIKAAESMGQLHDQLKAANYVGHDLEVYLVRLLFCLFADDTGIFEKSAFRDYISNRTSEDGSDLAGRLAELFEVLNTAEQDRLLNLDEDLATFPFVNGGLFAERLRLAAFDAPMRQQLLDCAKLDWGRISPAIFGSLFQSVMNPAERRELGAHYTEEKNILKVIRSLFLDKLRAEFDSARGNTRRLSMLQDRLSHLRFFDPACGCGNFLVIAYRELRRLELEIIKILQRGQQVLDVTRLSKVNVDQFFGLEIEEFPSQIAQVALWMMEHQMNTELGSAFGMYFARLPLSRQPGIYNRDALRSDWVQVVDPAELSYILGNPPFVGSKMMNAKQHDDMRRVFADVTGTGTLDYVSAWYLRAAQYIQGTEVAVAFVSTKSITQGEQVGPLWSLLLEKYHVKIQFAHRPFKWTSEARGKAAVQCVIVGFGLREPDKPTLFDYETPESDPHATPAKHINPYLVDGPDILLFDRSCPLSDVPEAKIGNKPIDNGNYLLSEEARAKLLTEEPKAAKYLHPWVGSDELIKGYRRYCLWLGEASPHDLRGMPELMRRVEAVREFRLRSKSESTRRLAAHPTRFHVENFPKAEYLVIPKVSSERREIIPMAFLTPDVLCSDLVFIVPTSSRYHFGVLSSGMHMAWVRYVAGRLEGRYRYSAGIAYNNFPWPGASPKAVTRIERAAEGVLATRSAYPESSLEDLYDPLAMPLNLRRAHDGLNTEVEKAYGRTFDSDAARIGFLLERYELLSKGSIAARRRDPLGSTARGSSKRTHQSSQVEYLEDGPS